MSEKSNSICRKEGVVVSVNNSYALIAVASNSTCSSCNSKIVCGTTDSKEFKIKNNKDLQAGQVVQIEMDNRSVILLALSCYGLSLFFAATVAFIASYLLELPDVYTAIIFLIATFVWFIIAGKLLGRYTVNKIKIYA